MPPCKGQRKRPQHATVRKAGMPSVHLHQQLQGFLVTVSSLCIFCHLPTSRLLAITFNTYLHTPPAAKHLPLA